MSFMQKGLFLNSNPQQIGRYKNTIEEYISHKECNDSFE